MFVLSRRACIALGRPARLVLLLFATLGRLSDADADASIGRIIRC